MMTAKTSELSSQLNDGNEISLSFHYHNKKIITFLNSLFTKILSRNNIIFLQSTLMTILRELIVNAVKANSKRVYFQKRHLDIFDNNHYLEGMKDFKDYIIENQETCENELKENSLKVSINIKKENNGITINVLNNVPILDDELEKINVRIEKAKEYNDFSEVYGDVTDDTEGEGLGILLTMLFLRNSGIGESSFSIKSFNGKTVSSLFVPYELQPKEIKTKIHKHILYEVNELPTFPNYIVDLQQMCRDSSVTFKDISDKISHDPSLSASVLKLANSAGFITRNRTENIDDAVKKIGLKNLNAILIATSARTIMENKYHKFKEIWNHCNKVAAYSRIIAQKLGYSKIIDKVFLAGLLHDLGKIVLLSATSALSEWISDVTKRREIRTTTIIEEVAIGISHSSIGEIIARKWNMPDYLIQAIKHHHSPLNAEKEFQAVVNIVYLANQYTGIETNRYTYDYIENETFTNLKSDKKIKITSLHDDVKKVYEEAII